MSQGKATSRNPTPPPHHLGMERKVTETSVAVAVTEKYLGLQYFTAEELKGVLNGSVLPLAWC